MKHITVRSSLIVIFTGFTLLNCHKESYINPSIVIHLNQIFDLKNTRELQWPKGNLDIAVYPNEHNPKISVELVKVTDLRCTECQWQDDYYIELLVNGNHYFLGSIQNPSIQNPNDPNPLLKIISINNYNLELVSVEKIGSELQNLTTSYKAVSLILKEI